MNKNEVKYRIEVAIQIFLKNDSYLISENLSERCITHKLATYIQTLFLDYNVDCEYNRNINEIKGLKLVKDELKSLGLLTKKELDEDENYFINRYVYPDIIIHKRGSNADNLCIIEVKKDNSELEYKKYDKLKLDAYTNDDSLKYSVGVFIEFFIREKKTNEMYKICLI